MAVTSDTSRAMVAGSRARGSVSFRGQLRESRFEFLAAKFRSIARAAFFHEIFFEVANPLRKISADSKKFDPAHLERIAPQLAVSVGLALRQAGDK